MEEERVAAEEPDAQDIIHTAIREGLTSFRDAFQVTCRTSDHPHNHCGQCKACIVDAYIHLAKEWWLQSGDLMKRRFLLALVNRLKPDILDHLAQILKPFINGKGISLVSDGYSRAVLFSSSRLHLHAK